MLQDCTSPMQQACKYFAIACSQKTPCSRLQITDQSACRCAHAHAQKSLTTCGLTTP